MNQLQQNIIPDHEEQFAEIFQQITHLISNDQLNEAAEHLSSLHHADLADFFDNTNYKLHKKILPLIIDKIKPETLVWLSNSAKHSFIEALGIKKTAALINRLDIEDSIEVIENVDEEIKQLLIATLSSDKQQQIIEGFTYPENTVGRVIQKNLVSFQENWTVGQAIDFIRHADLQGDFHAAIVVDAKYRPVGSVLLSTLLKNNQNQPLKELMNSDIKIADAYTELSELAFVFKQYALTIVPVVNKSKKLIGIVSIDSMLYIIEEQAEKDIMQLGGVYAQDIFEDLFYTVRHRFPWLFVNLITAGITSIVINQFSDTLAKLITLAVIMPIVASIGGNAGTQAMTVTIRAIANKGINNANVLKVIVKEILVCGLNGIFLALIGGGSLVLLFGTEIGIIFSVAVVINFLVAGFFGSVIPIALHNLNIDPATSSGVFLTTLTDSFGFFAFLTLAYVFLV